jgi:hypothetical protein
MDAKTASIADSIQANSFDADINSATNITPLSGEQTGSFFTSVPWYVWLIFVLVLAFFGFNIFVYLAKGTDDISNFFGPIIAKITSFFGIAAVDTAKQTASVAATGAGAIATSSEATQGQSIATTMQTNDSAQKTTLYNALNSTQQQPTTTNENSEYTADDSHSTIQQTKSANKAGWCYIGEDRGFRSCIKVSEGDTCMSGNIFPSEDICVNPSLRV